MENVSILDFIGTKDGGCGGDNWSYKMCRYYRTSDEENEFQMTKCILFGTVHFTTDKARPPSKIHNRDETAQDSKCPDC